MSNAKTESLPLSVIEKGLPTIRNNQELIEKVHNVFTPDKFVVLVPKALNIAENVKIAIQIVETDGNPDLKENRDFWGFNKSNDAIMSSRLINRLTAKANCRYTPSLTGISHAAYDKEDRPLVIRAKAHCTAIDSLGNLREGSGEYEYNYHEDQANTVLKPDQKALRRRVAVQLAITGAKKRAFFECIGIDTSISKSDVGKPFVVPCVIDDIDYSDPEVRRMAAARALGAREQLYGPGQHAVKAEYEVDNEGVSNESPDSGAPHKESPAPEQPSEGPPEGEKKSEPTATELRAMYEDEWKNSDAKQRGKKIRELAEKTGSDITGKDQNRKYLPPDEWTEQIQMKWIMSLAEKAGEIPKAGG
jgi:hypothetical protein